MTVSEAQLEIRTQFVGGFYGQLVSGTVWLTSAGLAVWRGPRASIIMLVVGGFFIFPAVHRDHPATVCGAREKNREP